ncbi:amidohydrolase family protein [Trinickia diaoshuihuensis]|uniref:amidohydrolase family protein n=1 Tax=Trinickia diaoshuihuensis TaxID=2292265 RepID=UPI000E26EFA0|nr:amidohydrolase family protein [Trinickia diaoshuihuensis]
MDHAIARSSDLSVRIPVHARSWVIRQTLCFDSAGYAFRQRDIEISGSRISALLPAGTSTLADGVDGSSFVCTPGVVGIETAMPRPRGATSVVSRPGCVTCIALHCTSMRELTESEQVGPMRTVALLEFSGNYLEQVNGFLEWFLSASRGRFGAQADPPLSVMPVLASARLLSASEVIEFAKFAKTMGTRIGVRLSSNADDALEFRSRFYCSESALMAYLLAHESNLTMFNASRIDRREASLLTRMNCAVSLDELGSPHDLTDLWKAHSPLFLQARAALHVRTSYAQGLLSRVAGGTPSSRLDRYADALTRSAALAVGLSDVGVLAPGMKADFCVFDRDRGDDYGAGSATLLSLLATREPAFTVVDGRALGGGATASAAVPAELAHA